MKTVSMHTFMKSLAVVAADSAVALWPTTPTPTVASQPAGVVRDVASGGGVLVVKAPGRW